ncbi:transposase, partial [Pseudostreptobacillus hongkongensis]|uniref:transposase n=1 Tax=Pseudostreptobacillus hongkongensis TaxID=1162717 RepID=UPI001B80A124
NITVNHIKDITGVHWNTIRKIHKNEIDIKLKLRKEQLKKENYKPKYIAIDEFAILKGHKYATVVLDLELGEAIWIGIGRSKESFRA